MSQGHGCNRKRKIICKQRTFENDDKKLTWYPKFINLTSGSSLRVGKELESCTYEVQLADEFTLDGRKIILIDTPGFDDTSKSDTDILRMIAAFLATT